LTFFNLASGLRSRTVDRRTTAVHGAGPGGTRPPGRRRRFFGWSL